MSYIGSIELTEPETLLMKSVVFDFNNSDHAVHVSNAKIIPQLMASLLNREAIPKHRVKYFEDPNFRKGRIKGSHRSLFERDGTVGVQIFEHYSFRKYLHYFLVGSDLPAHLIADFREKAEMFGHVGPSDAADLAKFAKVLVRRYELQPFEASEEFFKLSLDCGIYLGYCFVISETVRKMKG